MSGNLCPHRIVQRSAFAVLAISMLSACSWFTDMKRQPRFGPWESVADSIPPRGNPQNSVSVYGTVAPGYQYGRTALPGTIDSMSVIPNPVPADERSLANGRKYFQINCSVCHGIAGAGDGPATKYGMISMPLISDDAKGRSDGYIFGMIRNGRGAMPTYNRIEELDRWDVVNYVRALQGKINATVATGPLGKPGETGDKVPGVTQMGPTRPAPYYHRVGSQAGMALDASQHAKDSLSGAGKAPTDTTKKGANP